MAYIGPLRPLMCNWRRRRSRDSMLGHWGTEPRPKGGAPRWTSTPSSFHCRCSWTTGGGRTDPRNHRSLAAPPCSRRARSSPSPSSHSGPASAARGTSGASPRRTCAPTHLRPYYYYFPNYFPTLCSQTQLNRRIRALASEVRALLQQDLAPGDCASLRSSTT
jgi:hypothetical protein